MTASHISGPSIVYGEEGGTTAQYNAERGPSATYQGMGIIDVHTPYQLGKTGRGVVPILMNSPDVVSVDAVPSAFNAAGIAAAQAATSGTAMTLASVNAAGIGVNFPIIPLGRSITAANVVSVLALDPGFSSVATTAGSSVVTMTASTLALFSRMTAGLTLVIGSATNAWTIARVLSVVGLNITLDTVMPATNGAAVIALANAQFRTDLVPFTSRLQLVAGAVAMFDPRSSLARGVSVTTSAANAGGTVTVSGYDVVHMPMSETIACATAGAFYGNKCFKYVGSAVWRATAGGASAGTVSVGTSDLFGFGTRSDAFEYASIYWGGTFLTTSAGWYAADTTNPATPTTKDVRGAVQVSAIGPNATAIGANSSNGVRRLQLCMTMPSDNLAFATVANPAPMFGITQA